MAMRYDTGAQLDQRPIPALRCFYELRLFKVGWQIFSIGTVAAYSAKYSDLVV